MIGILLNDSAYEQDIRELLMAFYPGRRSRTRCRMIWTFSWKER